MSERVPLGPIRFLKWFCPPKLHEGIEGDLLEQYEMDVDTVGTNRARRRLMWNIITFIRPGILLRNKFSVTIIQWSMFRNYLKVAWRNLIRHQGYGFVNITGLTLGLSVAIVLFLIVKFENSFDTYHANADRLYQIKTLDKFGEPQSHVPQGVIKALKEQIPSVAKAASVYRWDPQVIRVGNENIKQKNTYFLHPEFLEMIDVKWKVGSPQKSLNETYQVVLDESTAEKLFGREDPLGKIIRYDNSMDLTVSGIIEKMPVQTDFQFQMIMSYETLIKYMGHYQHEDHWGGGDSWFHGYVMVKEDADIGSIEKQLATMVAQHKDNTTYANFKLLPLSQMHFDVDTDPFGYVMPVWMMQVLISIAIFLVLIASINFINLATAQSSTRSREIGVRKVMGSNRGSIIMQFFTETGVMVTLSVVIAAAVATFVIPYVDSFFNSNVSQIDVWNLNFVFYLLLLIIGVTMLAGFYPAFLLSGFKPVAIFRNQFSILPGKSVSLRKSLVVLQFVIAQVMIICMVIGIEQIQFFRQTDLGFTKDAIVTVNMAFRDSVLLQERYKQQLLLHPEIKDVTYGLTSPSSNRNWWWGNVTHPGLLNGEQTFRLQWIDPNYLNFYNIPLVGGRNFSPTDTSRQALINEKALRDMGFQDPERAIGETLTFWNNNTVTVIGVVKNYHAQGLKTEIPPHLYMYGNWNFQLAQIKIDPAQSASGLAHIENHWKVLHPDNYFEYHFLSDELNLFYEDERKLSNFIILFAVVGISLGCLGLFGLVSFVCAKRSKEVSIRKVLGATVSNIITLLSRDFVVLVLIAFMVAVPIGWYVMDRFLSSYTNQIEIHWSVFVFSGLATLILAMITVCTRAFSTAMLNPAASLKSE
jgi:putative ABC transport system permease protein